MAMFSEPYSSVCGEGLGGGGEKGGFLGIQKIR